VEFDVYLKHIAQQSEALRAAAVAAGPEAPVPTCPGWTVHDLVRHVARVHGWAGIALLADPAGAPPARPSPPQGWDELLTWWDGRSAALIATLGERGPHAPAWVFTPTGPRIAAFWARRQAHETAIHRLDAEHAHVGSDLPTSVPTLVYDTEFAADGIDEALTVSILLRALRVPITVQGVVLFHAADAGHAWMMHLHPGKPPVVGSPADHPAIDADATVVGTADAVYRAVWGRPSTAVRGGDQALIDALRAP
jgi:uncharacterized protein (TIGR03083 family)